MTTQRGRHRKLRRNILHTVIATALLAGTFTVVDQGINAVPANAAAPTIAAGGKTIDSTGTQFSLVFSETLGSTTALPISFTLGGTAITPVTAAAAAGTSIASVVASGTSLNFTLTNPVPSGLTLTVAYTAPASNSATTNNAIQDVNGNDAANIAAQTITTTASSIPKYASSTLNAAGSLITLTFNEALNATTAVPSSFTVKSGTTAATTVPSVVQAVSSVSVSGSTVLLNLSSRIESGLSVSVEYTAPANDPLATNAAIQDTAGNDAASFTTTYAKTVTSSSGVPRLTGATNAADGHTVVLTFNQSLNTASLPAISDFTVKANGNSVSLSSVSASASSVTLTLVGTIETGATITASYLPPNAWNVATTNVSIQKITTGEDALAFTDFPVTNLSGAPYVTSTSTSTDGYYIYLNFNEDMDQTTIKTLSQFAVKINGSNASLSDSRIDGARKVYVRLNTRIQRTDVVTLSYTPTSYNATASGNWAVLQDVGGTDAPALVDFPITNSSTYDTRPPVLQSAVVSADGLSMQLTVNEAIQSFTTLSTGWLISVNGVARSVASVTNPVAPVTTFTFNFSQANQIGAGAVVTVGYTNNAYANKFQDTSNNQAATFSGFAATNNSTADKTSPVLQSIQVPASGDRLILSYNESLGSSLPVVNTSNFGVTSGGVAWIPTGISVSGSDVILTGPSSIEIGKTVVLTKYTAPSSDPLATNAAIQDTNGNDAATLSNVAVTNNSTIDLTSPTWVSATTNSAGDQVTLTFNEDISSDQPPLAGAFTLATSAGTAPTVTTASISGQTVVLSLSGPIQNSATATFTYTAPNATLSNGLGNAAIQDLAGNDAATLTAKAIVNNSSYDTLGPVLTAQSISTNGQTLTLTFNEAVGSNVAPKSAFSVIAASSPVSVSSVSVSGNTVVLTLASVIQVGQTVNISYSAPAQDSAILNSAVQDLVGNDALAFSNQAVVNGSTMDTVRPDLSLVARPTLAANGTTLTLTFSEALAAATASLSDFVVNVNSSPVTISTVTRPTTPGTTIVLTLSAAVDGGLPVTVAYSAPSNDSANTNSAIQDTAGNDALTFSAQTVTNNSTQGRPIFAAIIVGTDGQTVNFCYNKTTTDSLSLSNGTFVFKVNGVVSSFWTNNGSNTSSCPVGTVAGPRWTQPSTTVRIGDVVTVSRTESGTGTSNLRTITDFPVTNNSTLLGRPGVTSIVVDSTGTNIRINYEGTAPNPVPALSDFQWSVNGQIVPLTGSGGTTGTGFFAANIISKIFQGDVVTASYVQPNINIATVKSFSNLEVTNNSTADGTPPSLSSVANTADGMTLTLTFDEDLLISSPPLASQFAVATNGYATSVSSLSVSGRTVVLTLASPIGENATASVTYTAPAFSRLTSNSAAQDASGNDSATFTGNLSPNLSTVNQGPMLVSTSVNTSGNSIVLTYDENLSSTTAPTSAFTATANGVAVNVTSVTIDGSTVVLMISPAIENSDTVQVAYVAPTLDQTDSNSAVQGIDGFDAASFALTDVTTNSSSVDTKGPILTNPVPTILATGSTLTLTFNEDLGQTTASTSSFTVLVDGVAVVPSSVSIVNNQAILNFSPVLGAGRIVTVAYASPGVDNSTGDSALQDVLGNNVVSFSAQAVTNNSTVDNTGPVLSLIARPSLAANGTTLTLAYNEDLATAIAAGSTFTVMSGTTPVTVSTISKPTNTTIQLTLATVINGGAEVTVAYAAPTIDNSSTSNSAVQDSLGNDSLSFSAQAVTNNSTQGPPGFVSGSVNADGTSVTIVLTKGTAMSSAWASNFTLYANGSAIRCSALSFGAGPTYNVNVLTGCAPTIPAGAEVTATWVRPDVVSFPDQTIVNFTDKSLTNNSTQPADVVAPVFSSAIMTGTSGTTIELTYDEAIGGTLPTADMFVVMASGTRHPVGSVAVDGTKVTLTLASFIEAETSVTVAYHAPSPPNSWGNNAAIQDASGNDVLSLAATPVTNTSLAGPDVIKPTYVSMSVVGDKITLTMNESLNSTTAPPGAYTIFVGNNVITATTATASGSTIELTLPAGSIPSGTPVTLSYNPPAAESTLSTSNLAVQDLRGNDALAFNASTQVPQNTSGFIDSPAPNSLGCGGGWHSNRTKQRTLPNGMWYRVGVTGDNVCINDGYEAMSQRGGVDDNFWMPGLTQDQNMFIQTSEPTMTAGSTLTCTNPEVYRYTAQNGALDETTICRNRGFITISFPYPVTDPIFSFAGLGSGSGSITSFTELDVVTPNATVTKLAGTNIEVTNGTHNIEVTNGTHIAPINWRPNTHCHRTNGGGYGSTGPAGCGSFKVNGLVQEIKLAVSYGATMLQSASTPTRDLGNYDHWNLLVSFEEDFGLVPTSYDSVGATLAVASHVITGINSGLRMGSAIAPDNTSRLYSETNDDSVTAGVAITTANQKYDDGVTAWRTNPSLQLVPGDTYSVPVSVVGVKSAANLCGWIDFDRNGAFSSGERACAPALAANATTANLSWTVPQTVVPGPTYSRIRLSYDPLPLATGKVASGEVEDYSFVMLSNSIPVALNDSSSGELNEQQVLDIVANDQFESTRPADPETVCLVATSTTSPTSGCVKTLTVPNEGTYVVNPTTGVVTFTPVNNYSGTATPIDYQVTEDATDSPQTRTATISVVVNPAPNVPPTADDETSSGPFNTAQTIDVLDGDVAGSAPLVPSTLRLCGPAEVAPDCNSTSVTIPDEGTYTIVAGKVVFTPDSTFFGAANPIDYIIEDELGQVADASISPTVLAPPAPTANPDTTSGPWNQPQSINVVDNASGNTGDDAAGTGATLDPTSVVLSCGTAANCTTATVDGKVQVTIANQGTYSLGADGVVIFTPVSGFKGTATPVTYTVTDSSGQTASSTYTPTVAPPPAPMADPETTSGIKGATQTIDLLPGDTTFDPAITLVRSSIVLSCTAGVPNCTVAANKVTIAGVGTYEIDPNNPGHMLFTPEPNFTGTGPSVTYTITDSMGGTATSTYTPTVIAPPTVRPDTSSAGWDVTQSMNVVTSTSGANTTNTNTSSQDSAATGTTLKANSLTIDCASAIDCTETVDGSGVVTAVTMAGQGTYTVTANNTITFDPVASFVGTARPVTYSISDELNQTSSTTYTPTVVVPLPIANPETKVATLVLVNPPTPVAPTDPNYQDYLDELNFGPMHWTKTFTSVLQGSGALASGTALKSGTTDGPCLIDPVTNVCSASVTIPGEGTYTMDQTTGVVTFVSEVVVYDTTGSNFPPGPKTAISYRVTDALGRTATSTLTPVIPPPPTANPDVSTGVQGETQTLSPVGNDRPGGGASTTLYPDTRTETPSGIYLCDATQPPPDCQATTVEVFENNVKLGTLTVAANGLVTFTPEPDFVGTTPPIGYQIPDNLGQKAYSTITITVLPPPAPSATLDTGSAEYNKPVTLKPWLNDSAGAVPDGSSAPAPNLIATSIRLCDDNETIVAMSQTPADCTAMKVTTIEGTYEVNATTGEVVFTPVDGFIGTVKYPPTYQIWTDWAGPGGAKSATALLVPTIAPPGAPAAEVDVTVTKPGTSVVLNPVENDIPGTAVLDPKTVRLCGADEISPECTQMSVTTLDGTYVVDPETGKVTFTPRDGFTGKATIPYIIHDALGMVAASHLIITVEDTAVVPVVTPVVHKKQLPKTGGTRPDLLVLLGLAAIAGAGGLRVASRRK